MKAIAAAIFFGLVVVAAGYACGKYLEGGYAVDRQINFMSQPIVIEIPEGGQQY